MLRMGFHQLRTILCLGAHPDDIEIGCGGTLLKLLAEHRSADVYWVVLGANGERAEEAARGADEFLRDAGKRNVRIKGFRDSYFPHIGGEIKDYFEQLKREVSPDLIFTHRREDMHQDHRLVAELTWCAFRDHLILEYEIPKFEGDLGHPNFFVPLEEPTCRRKIDTIANTYRTQHSKTWFSEDTYWALLRIRGVECNAPSKFAEAFDCRKLTV